MTAETRTTFLQGDQILVRTRDMLEKAGETLDRMRDGDADPRARMFAERVERQRSALAAALDEYLRDAPKSVLDHFAQYSADFSNEPLAPPERLTIAEMTRWIVSITERLEKLFDALAAQSASEEAKDGFANLAALARARGRRIAEEAASAGDL